ncbi:MAG: hypothetical protein KID09_20415 [Paenibacillus macerans]|nr:hypothetical protein [Paenibacillus macerans]
MPEEALALDYACAALLAEGRCKAQADSLKKMHAGGQAGRNGRKHRFVRRFSLPAVSAARNSGIFCRYLSELCLLK